MTLSFDVTNETLCEYFLKLVHNEFEISMMEELKFFLRLQIKQTNKGRNIHSLDKVCEGVIKEI